MRLLLTALLCLAIPAAPALADSAISMHGTPKYGPGFAALDYANPAAPQGGALRLAMTGSFDNLNPYSVRGNRGTGFNLTGESLLGRSWDEPFSLYALIAEDVTTPDDRSWVEFRLNPKAHWNDGTPITVEDVLYSWQALRDKGRPNHQSYYKKVISARAVDERTVRFEFDMTGGGDREMPLIMGLMPILNKAWWQSRDVSAPGLGVPVTSGPYKLTAVEPGRRLVYTRDKNYWGNELAFNKGQWNFDTITYDYYRDDGIALEAFKAGAYDLRRENDPIKWLSGYNIPAIQTGQIIRREIANTRTEPVRGFIFNTRRALFTDIRVREALTTALDFEWMNKALFGDIYRRAGSIYPNSELAFSGLPEGEELKALAPLRSQLPASIFTTPFALPKSDGSGPGGMRANYRHAIELLAQAGWRLTNGVMTRGSETFTFEILLNNPADTKIALEYTRSLARLGIKANVRMVDSAQYQSRLTDYDYDMLLNFWSSTLSPGNEQVFYWGSAGVTTPGTRNYAGVNSPVVDQLASALAASRTREELVGRAHALDRVIMNGYYIAPLYYLGRDLVAYRNTLGVPDVTPVYGILPEQTWWAGAAPAPAMPVPQQP